MKIMKNIVKFSVIALALCSLMACEKHDVFDDRLVYIGEFAPQLFWNVPSTVVSAGDSVAFTAQYYTTGKSPLSHLQVWYNVREKEEKSVTIPWISSTTTLNVSSNAVIERRISQAIEEYKHNEAWKVEFDTSSMGDTTYFKPVYKFAASFPTSNTLGKVILAGEECDSANVIKYFGDDFMETTKQNVLAYLRSASSRNTYRDIYNLVFYKEDINPDTHDTIPSEADNKGSRSSKANYAIYTRWLVTASAAQALNDSTFFDKNSDTWFTDFREHQIPDSLMALVESLDFRELTTYAGEQSVNYNRAYELDAQLKCYDQAGNAGLSLVYTISLN